MRKVLLASVRPVVAHTVLWPIRVVLLLAIRVHHFLEVFRLELGSVFRALLTRRPLLLLEPVLFLSGKLHLFILKRPLVRSESRVGSR